MITQQAPSAAGKRHEEEPPNLGPTPLSVRNLLGSTHGDGHVRKSAQAYPRRDSKLLRQTEALPANKHGLRRPPTKPTPGSNVATQPSRQNHPRPRQKKETRNRSR